jgi:pyruvate dehydrogenase E2 component (dihydrolipoamide acetyltransferase)
MAYQVILPRQGQSVESCIITQWNKKVGEEVKTGDVLFTYETDKATFEEQAKEDGKLLAVFFKEDDDVPVLTAVAVIGQDGEDISSLTGQMPAQKEHVVLPAQSALAAVLVQPAAALTRRDESPQIAIGVSPRARATASRLGVDVASALPTGPQGRVIERDIFAARAMASSNPQVLRQEAEKATPPPLASVVSASSGQRSFTENKLSNIRRVIARTMQESISQMAQLTHHSSFDATQLLALREQFKNASEEMGLGGVTINDLILFAASRTLMKHPALNAHFLGDRIRQYDHVHLGVAVDTPRGLLVPTLFDADTKSLKQLSREAKETVKLAQSGSINPDLLTEGTFTISNLGSLGIEMFTPIINPPQVGILGVDCVIERVRSVGGHISVYPAMGLSLTYDHRAVDGAPASRFLKDLVTALENIGVLLVN